LNQQNQENARTEIADTLTAGIEILAPLMVSHGFVYFQTAAGVGSGGPFASGEFRRSDRRLELHFRYSLGLVTYHLGSAALSHEEYMWSVLGRRHASHYPGFSRDALGGFRHLLLDLEQYSSDFLTGFDIDFIRHIEQAELLKTFSPRIP
jgi:hypothetical protein